MQFGGGGVLHSEIIARKVAEIRPRFLVILSQRLDRFEEIRDLLETTHDSGPLLDEIRSGAHSTVGLATTLGYPDLGTLAQDVERAVHRMAEAGSRARPTREVLDSLDDLLGEMALILHM